MTHHTLTLHYDKFDTPDELPPDEQQLVKAAWAAREKAYAPYSHFLVGAAVLTRDGQIIQGSNQENATYKVSCAERVALDSTGAAGKKNQVTKLAIAGGPESMDITEIPLKKVEPVTPCGSCRQDIVETEDVSGNPIVIILASRNEIRRFVGIDNLLPFPFGPKDLGIKF